MTTSGPHELLDELGYKHKLTVHAVMEDDKT